MNISIIEPYFRQMLITMRRFRAATSLLLDTRLSLFIETSLILRPLRRLSARTYASILPFEICAISLYFRHDACHSFYIH